MHDMPMTSMKMTSKETKATAGPSTAMEHSPYPYGLRLHLDEASLGKLKVTGLPEVGTVMRIYAEAEVTDTHQSSSEQGEHQTLTLQITDLALVPAHPKKDADAQLYGG